MRVWTPPVALQVACALGSRTGPLCELLLREPGGTPETPQVRTERRILPCRAHLVRPSFVVDVSKTAYLSPTTSRSSRRHRRSARFTRTPAFQVPEKCRRGVDGLQPHRRAHWEPEQEVGCGRKSKGGRARTTRGKRRAPGQ
jgi:hypothetical protein